MKATLIQTLRSETSPLLSAYLERVRQWSIHEFSQSEERFYFDETDWCKYLGIEPEMKNAGTSMQSLGFPKGFHNTKDAARKASIEMHDRGRLKLGLFYFIEKEQIAASEHYERSLEKLALRIESKGLNLETLTVQNASIGMNLNITLSDGIKSVRAFTIVAEGLVQRPHYRYLIK